MDRLEHMLEQLSGVRVLVVGLARSGMAAARVLLERGSRVTGTDRRAEVPKTADLVAAGATLALGGDRTDLLDETDLVVLSPGVPLTSAIPKAALKKGLPVIGELELACRLSQVPFVAITGTNGKSTTTALCAHLLKRAGHQVFLGGNIGHPLCEMLLEDREPDWAVVEVSSFQLEHLSHDRAVRPKVAIWLNLTPDHLDRHGDMDSYGAIKRRLFTGQQAGDRAVFFADDPLVRKHMAGLAGQARLFGRSGTGLSDGDVLIQGNCLHLGQKCFRLDNPRLAGDHNAENAAAAVLAVTAVNVDDQSIESGLLDFAGLPHRLELVAESAAVRWVNDSKGTNPDATAKSLTSFDCPVLLIAGGQGKGTDYQKLRQPVSQRVVQLILLGEDAPRLARDLDGCAPIHMVDDMAQAVSLARELAQAEQVVLLSPACASFDMFRDYAQRGEVFARLARGEEGQP